MIIALYIKSNYNSFKEAINIDFKYLAPISILSIILIYLNGIFLKIITEPFKIELKEHFLISTASSFLNLVTPFRGGAGARAIYMKKKYKLSYANFTSSLFGNYIIIFMTASIFALLLFAVIYARYHIFNLIISLIFLVIFLGTLSLIIFHFKFKNENSFTSKINKVLEGWQLISKSKITVLKLTLNVLSVLFIDGIRIYLIFEAIGIDPNLLKSLYFTIINVLSSFINITPGAFGITEGLFFISSKVLGIPASIGLIVALISRGISSITLITLGPIANYLLYNKYKINKP